jgi:hypothetical protein
MEAHHVGELDTEMANASAGTTYHDPVAGLQICC